MAGDVSWLMLSFGEVTKKCWSKISSETYTFKFLTDENLFILMPKLVYAINKVNDYTFIGINVLLLLAAAK